MTNIHDTLNAIKEAASALEREPQHLEHIRSLREEHDRVYMHNQELELRATSYRTQINELAERVRSLEVERDDASFRADKAEDTVTSLRKSLKDWADDINLTVEIITPVQEQQAPTTGVEQQSPEVVSTGLETQATSPVPSEDYQPPHPVQATENDTPPGYVKDPVTGRFTPKPQEPEESLYDPWPYTQTA